LELATEETEPVTPTLISCDSEGGRNDQLMRSFRVGVDQKKKEWEAMNQPRTSKLFDQ